MVKRRRIDRSTLHLPATVSPRLSPAQLMVAFERGGWQLSLISLVHGRWPSTRKPVSEKTVSQAESSAGGGTNPITCLADGKRIYISDHL
jgi:hypothetical protein